jgi:hypothetical protein
LSDRQRKGKRNEAGGENKNGTFIVGITHIRRGWVDLHVKSTQGRRIMFILVFKSTSHFALFPKTP